MCMTENINWLKDFNRRFDAEVKQLHMREPFWQLCRRCPDGHCCGDIIFPVKNRLGNPFLAEEWWMMLDQVRGFSNWHRKQLALNILSKRRACIFLFGNRCAVHAGRPWTCRFHPYTVSFSAGEGRFPVGEIALPSCPGYAAAFGLAVGEEYIQKLSVVRRDGQNPRLVLLKLKKHRPVWLIDAGDYLEEYERQARDKGNQPSEWQVLLDLAKQVGGAECDILPLYVEHVLGLQPLSR